MKNVEQILKDAGVELTDEQKAAVNAAISENYRTIADYDKQVKKTEKSESERIALQQQLTDAQDTIRGFDGVDVEKLNKDIAEWKQRAEKAEKDAQKQIYDRDFSDALKTELENVRFTSEAAKRDVMTQIRAAELKLKDGKILGLADLIEQIKKNDASAFVDEKQEQLEAGRAKPFTWPLKGAAQPTTSEKFKAMSLDERMKLKASDPEAYERMRKGE